MIPRLLIFLANYLLPRKNYAVIDKALLSILETYQEFRSMLLDAVLHVHTDHRIFIHNTLYIQRVLRWRLYIEEYLRTFLDVKGTNNVNY